MAQRTFQGAGQAPGTEKWLVRAFDALKQEPEQLALFDPGARPPGAGPLRVLLVPAGARADILLYTTPTRLPRPPWSCARLRTSARQAAPLQRAPAAARADGPRRSNKSSRGAARRRVVRAAAHAAARRDPGTLRVLLGGGGGAAGAAPACHATPRGPLSAYPARRPDLLPCSPPALRLPRCVNEEDGRLPRGGLTCMQPVMSCHVPARRRTRAPRPSWRRRCSGTWAARRGACARCRAPSRRPSCRRAPRHACCPPGPGDLRAARLGAPPQAALPAARPGDGWGGHASRARRARAALPVGARSPAYPAAAPALPGPSQMRCV